MWIILAFLSALLLGCYDVFKKVSLKDNAVIPVLFLNTIFCSLIFLPLVVLQPVALFLPTAPSTCLSSRTTPYIFILS